MRKLRIELREVESDEPGEVYDVNAAPLAVAIRVDVPIREGYDLRDQAARACRKACDLLGTAGSGTGYNDPRKLPAPQPPADGHSAND